MKRERARGLGSAAVALCAALLLELAAGGEAIAGPSGKAAAGEAAGKPKAASPKEAPKPKTGAKPGATPAPAPKSPAEARLAQALDRLQNRYATAQDVQADFTQELLSTTLGKTTQNGRGHVYFKKPGKMRWVYEEPEEQITVSDGNTLWFYQPRIRQVLANEVTAEQLSKYTVSFLTGVGDVRKDFRAEPGDEAEGGAPEAPGAGGPIRIMLYPIEEAPFTKVLLEVSPETHLVQTTVIYDHFGNENRIVFQSIRINSGVTDNLFTFEVPEGVQVIRPSEPLVPAP